MGNEEQLTLINMIKANIDSLEKTTKKEDEKKDRTEAKKWYIQNIISLSVRLKDSL